MTDSLRDRIAAVLDKHYPQTTGYQDELTDWCQCGMPRDHVADVVVTVVADEYIDSRGMFHEPDRCLGCEECND